MKWLCLADLRGVLPSPLKVGDHCHGRCFWMGRMDLVYRCAVVALASANVHGCASERWLIGFRLIGFRLVGFRIVGISAQRSSSTEHARAVRFLPGASQLPEQRGQLCLFRRGEWCEVLLRVGGSLGKDAVRSCCSRFSELDSGCPAVLGIGAALHQPFGLKLVDDFRG